MIPRHKYSPPDEVMFRQINPNAKRYNSSFEDKLRRIIKQEVGIDPYENIKKRNGNYPLCRQLFMVMLRKYTDKSLAAIGQIFDTSHDYVIFSITVINNRTCTNKEIKALFERIDKRVKLIK